MAMELRPFFQHFESEGNLRLSFTASLSGDDTAIFNFRTFETGRDTDHDAFEYDAAHFLSFPPSLMDSLVSEMMSGLACLRDDAACLFWGDLVALLVGAALTAEASPQFLQTGRGIRFNVDFYVESGTVTYSAGDADGYESAGGVTELKRLKYDVDGGFKERDCPICFEGYESSGKDLTEMPCLHCFHYDCVARWLKISPSCPLCRQHVD